MSSLVSLANDIFAADLNELDQFREQLELRAAAQKQRAEREEMLKRRALAEKEVARRNKDSEQQQPLQSQQHGRAGAAGSGAAKGGRAGAAGGTAAASNSTNNNNNKTTSSSSGAMRSSPRQNAESGAGGSLPDSGRGSVPDSAHNLLSSSVPLPVIMPVTDLTGIVPDSRVDPFLEAIQRLDNHAAAVAEANAPYQKWMKRRMGYLQRRRNLVGGHEPIPEDIFGETNLDDDDDLLDGSRRAGGAGAGGEGGSAMPEQPPPLAIPLLEFTRRHAAELKKKYSYNPPRGLLEAGKVTKEEAEAMAREVSDEVVAAKLASHSAGATWKAPDEIKGGAIGAAAAAAVMIAEQGGEGGAGPARSAMKSQRHVPASQPHVVVDDPTKDGTATNATRRSRRSQRPGSAHRSSRRSSATGTGRGDTATTSGSDNDTGAHNLSDSFAARSMSDYTEMYVQESKGAAERRAARQREADKFHAKLGSAVEFSDKRLVFRECVPGESYTQTFKIWNRSNDLRRFKVVAGSSDALHRSRIPGRNLDATWGKKVPSAAATNSGGQLQQPTSARAGDNSSNNNKSNNKSQSHYSLQSEQHQQQQQQPEQEGDFDTDGREAFDIPFMDVRVTTPANFSPEMPIAPGTHLIVEVVVRPHWSAYESADCSIAVAHVRDVHSCVRAKNELSQWHCEELPVLVEMLQPRLVFEGAVVDKSLNDGNNNNNNSSSNNNNDGSSGGIAAAGRAIRVVMPTCFFGNKVTETVRVKNVGAKAMFSLRLQPMINQFTVEPNLLELDRGMSETITITHTPRQDQHGGKNVDTATLTFEGSLLPSPEAHKSDPAATRKGRRRVLKQIMELVGTGTDACVFVSTIGTAAANQVAMKGHRGVDAVGTVNINDAVVGFAAWRPVTVTNDSELAVPVSFVSTCASHGPLAVLDVRPASILVPPRSSAAVELWLSTRKELLLDPILLQKEIAGRFFMYVPRNSGVPEVAVQRAHERRFESLRPKVVPRAPRDEMTLIKHLSGAAAACQEENDANSNNNNVTNSSSSSSSNNSNNSKIVKNDIFIEEFDMASKPSRPSLSFTPTLLNLSDVEALTNQTNICDAILRNDGAGELSFYFMSVEDRVGLQATGFSPNKMRRRALNNHDDTSSDEDRADSAKKNSVGNKTKRTGSHEQEDESGVSKKNITKRGKSSAIDPMLPSGADGGESGSKNKNNNATTAKDRENLLISSQQAGGRLLQQCGVDVGHYFDEKGGIEWWAVPSQGTIAPGVELRVSIRYVVRRAGPVRAVLEAFSPLLGGDCSPRITVDARGRGPCIRASVPSLEFGAVSFGQQSEVRFSLFNPTENAVLVSIRDGHANDGAEYAQMERDAEGTVAAAAKITRLIVAPGQCTLHPRQTVNITVYLRAIHAGKNEDFVHVEVEDGTDLMIPFSADVVVPELVVTPSTINLGKVDRDVVLPCSVLLSNPSCIPISFEVVEIDQLAGICSVDLIGCNATVPAGALNVPINFTVCFEQTRDAPVSVVFAFSSPALDAPVLVQLKTESVCQPTVSLAVTLPGQALFCQSTDGFIGALLSNIVDDAIEMSDKNNSIIINNNNNSNSTSATNSGRNRSKKKKSVVEPDAATVVPTAPKTRVVAPFVDPIVLTGSIDATLPYCAQDFQVLIRNPTGCVFPCDAKPMRYPASTMVILPDEGEDTAACGEGGLVGSLGGAGQQLQQHHLTPVPPTSAINNNNKSHGGFPAGSAAAQSARSVGRSTRLPGVGSSAVSVTSSTTATTAAGGGKLPPPPVPPLASHTAGRTFFCRDEDGTDARDRSREQQLAKAAALVQTGRELAVEVRCVDTNPPRSVACTLHGYDVHTLAVRCLATIPGVFHERLRLDFGTGVPSTELPVTVRVSGAPIVIDPSTSAMTTDPASGITKLQLPSVVAGMRSVKRTLQITSRCPRDLRVDCRIAVTGASVGSVLLPADIFGGEAAVSTALFSKEGGGSTGSGVAMERSWATVAPGSFILGALQSAQLTIEYAPPSDARVPSWEGILHITSTIAQTGFNDKFLISEFYEIHGARYPAERSLNPMLVGERTFAQNNASASAPPAPVRVKGVAKLPLRTPVIKRAGVVENGVLIHRAAAQLVANQQYEAEQEANRSAAMGGGVGSSGGGTKMSPETKRYVDDSSSDDDEFGSGDDDNGISGDDQTGRKKKKKKVEDPRDLIARVKRERPASSPDTTATTTNNIGITTTTHFDAANHEACVAETVLILHHLRRRYEELRQFTAGGFIEPTQLYLRVKHLQPLLDIDPYPLVRFTKCFVPQLPPGLALTPMIPSSDGAAGALSRLSPTPPLSFDIVAASVRNITPLPSNITSVRLRNNGITTIDTRLFLAAATAQHFKVVGFSRRHSDARPKRAASKYEASPVEAGVLVSGDGDWTSAEFRMVPQEIVDLSVALYNAAGNHLNALIAQRTMATVAQDPATAAPHFSLSGTMDLRFSNGEAQAVQLSAHVYVPRVSLVEDRLEFLPTVEVSLGKGQSTLSRRITLINASPCPAAFEIVPAVKLDYQQQQQQGATKLRFEGEEEQDVDVDGNNDGNEQRRLQMHVGSRSGVARAAAAALKKSSQPLDLAEQQQQQHPAGAVPGSVNRRSITVKAAANSVDAVGIRNSTAPLYDPGRFRFSQQRGHLPPATAAGAPSRLEVDVFFDPFASQLFNAEFQVAVDGGIGATLFILAQSRVTEV